MHSGIIFIAAVKSACRAWLFLGLFFCPLLAQESTISLHFDVITRPNERKIVDVTFGPNLTITDRSQDPIIVKFEIGWNDIDHVVVSPVGNLYDEVSVFPKEGAKWHMANSSGHGRDEPGWKGISTPNRTSARQLSELISKYSGARIIHHYWPREGL
jgi:hypothetical protein